MMKLRGIYPGSFDPFTKGHADIVERAMKVVSELFIAVSSTPNKKTLFTAEERIKLVHASIGEMDEEIRPKITVLPLNGLLVDFMKAHQGGIVFRGLRATTDFEYEFQMASVNRKLDPNVDTVFLTASDKYHFVSASIMREIAQFGGDVSNYVAAEVAKSLKEKFSS